MNGKGFEQKIISVLSEQDQLRGYGLFGWTFSHGNHHLEIDGLLLLNPGIFVCYEAKNYYRGVWMGNINSQWRCGNDLINSGGKMNPHHQIQQYVFHIKDKIVDKIRKRLPWSYSSQSLDNIPWVCGLIVVPDGAQIQIESAHVDSIDRNTIYGRSIHICHLSKLVEVVGQIQVSNAIVPKILQDAGGLQQLAEELIENPKYIRQIIEKQSSNLLKIIRCPDTFPPLENPVLTQKLEPGGSSGQGSHQGSWRRWLWTVFFLVLSLLVSIVGFKYYQFINRPRLAKDELKIGILTQPEAYSPLVTYLKERIIPDDFANFLFRQGKEIKVYIVGNSSLTYQQAKQSITNNEWDIAFTLSPSLSVAAREAGYQFVARMFPDKPRFYRSALFVRSDSQIYSLEDLNAQTKVGLGDFKSMSSFYMPLYDLYGKTLTIETGLKRISAQVKNGVVQVGAGVATNVEKDPELRIIHLSRDIPGSGVYVTSRLSKRERMMLQKVLLDAPKEVQTKANYGPGQEPDYTEFMKIRTRVEEILACIDFSKNPVKLFCANNPLIIKGRINGSTLVDKVTLELKVMGENGTIYKVIVPRFITHNFTQIQNKSVTLQPTNTPRQIDVNVYEIVITNPSQILIENQSSSQKIVPAPERTTLPTSTGSASEQVLPTEAPLGLLTGYVADVKDGDNVTIETLTNDMVDIRLACIDAPEMAQIPWGERSTQYMKKLLPTGTKINYRPVAIDRYGRLVAEIFVNSQSINLKMVHQGEAVVYHRYLSSCEADRQKYLDAQTQAQRQNLGFWSQPEPEMPWDFRKRNRG